MFELFLSGGWMMYPLLGSSIIAFAIVIERLFFVRHSYIIRPKLLQILHGHLRHGALSESQIHQLKQHPPIGLTLFGLIYQTVNEADAKIMLQDELDKLTLLLERNLTLLGTVALISPLMGLLGTVLGMINIFAELINQQTNPEILASGISQALITTAAGLMVSIPATFFHRLFQQKANHILVDFEKQCGIIIELTRGKKRYV